MVRNRIKILDCTLRDGGYVNNWNFGCDNIKHIIKELSKADIDFIECGYLRACNSNQNQAVFSNVNNLIKIITSQNLKKNYTLMINYGEYPIENIEECVQNNIFLRIAFKKEQLDEALEYCHQAQAKGYKIFVHPMHTGTYSKKELINLVKKVNKLNPFGLTIVDTTGSMTEKDIIDLYSILDKTLSSTIVLAFHSHDNLRLSFKNAKLLMQICTNRELVVDTTLKGMGRGAGNLETEVMIKNLGGKYNENIILELIEKVIDPIYQKIPRTYSEAYKFSAQNYCHPNYATFLINKKLSDDDFEKILLEIPSSQKLTYNESLIENIFKKWELNIGVFGR